MPNARGVQPGNVIVGPTNWEVPVESQREQALRMALDVLPKPGLYDCFVGPLAGRLPPGKWRHRLLTDEDLAAMAVEMNDPYWHPDGFLPKG